MSEPDLVLEVLRDPAFYYGATAYLGLVAGAFLTVLVPRLDGFPASSLGAAVRHVSFPGSHCPGCKRHLTWVEKLPVLGWVFCGGRCRGCGMPIPLLYPGIELAVAVSIALLVAPYRDETLFFLYPMICVVLALLLATSAVQPHGCLRLIFLLLGAPGLMAAAAGLAPASIVEASVLALAAISCYLAAGGIEARPRLARALMTCALMFASGIWLGPMPAIIAAAGALAGTWASPLFAEVSDERFAPALLGAAGLVTGSWI